MKYREKTKDVDENNMSEASIRKVLLSPNMHFVVLVIDLVVTFDITKTA